MLRRALVVVWLLCCWGALAVNDNSEESFSLRLVRGGSRCRGLLEVQRSGQDWITVTQQRSLSTDVPLWFGNRVCALLDCGFAVTVRERPSTFRAVYFLVGRCENSSLLHCLGSGREYGFTRLDLLCSGALDVNGESAEPYSLRLVGGGSRCRGVLEVQTLEWDWIGVRSEDAPLWFGNRVCSLMDCGFAVTVKVNTGSSREAVSLLENRCEDSSLLHCLGSIPVQYRGPSLEMLCSGALYVNRSSPELFSLRLAKGDGPCRGELQVQGLWEGQEWAVVRPDSAPVWFGDRICAELDCGSALTAKEKKLGYRDAVTLYPDGCVDASLYYCFDSMTHRSPYSLMVTCSEAQAVNGSAKEPFSLRLVGGDSRCRGQLQVLRLGEDWTGVDPSDFTLLLGNKVCAELDCGSALTVDWRRVSYGAKFRVSYSPCEATSLIHCFGSNTHDSIHSLELSCSDSVRLVSGRSLCSGSLQIRDPTLNQSWTSVCEGALDRRGAEVLCRELSCGAPRLQGELSPLGQMFHCEGNESALMDCTRNQTRTDPGTCSRPALHLTCSEPLRLVGAQRCEGTLELKHRGEWRHVKTMMHWDLKAADTVCHDLDCGSAVSTTTGNGLDRSYGWGVTSQCVKKAAVRDCVFSTGYYDLKVVCSDSVRLVSGRSLCSGSLQIRDQSLNRSWTSVCEGALDRRGAEVLCRELVCGTPLLQGELSPLGQMFHCEGHESALMDCPRNQSRTDPGTCPTLNLTCSEPLRLVGGANRCEGTVEVNHVGEWRRVESWDFWDLDAAAAVCRALDCGPAVSTEERRDLKESYVFRIKPGCVRKTALRECIFTGSSDSKGGIVVRCSDSVRLVSGRSLCSGSLQIRDQSLNRSWTSVCEGSLGRRGAKVLCRELGCWAPRLQGELSPLGQMFHCEGHESALMDCPRNQTRTVPGTCPTLHLTCSEPMELLGGSSRCEGTVYVQHRGQWKRMYSSSPWNLEAAAAVCRDLDCGSVVSTEVGGRLENSNVWGVSVDCVTEKKAGARECIYTEYSFPTTSRVVVCSGET